MIFVWATTHITALIIFIDTVIQMDFIFLKKTCTKNGIAWKWGCVLFKIGITKLLCKIRNLPTQMQRTVESIHCHVQGQSACICACMRPQLLQSYLILCHLVDCSLLGSSVHGILQARVLWWVVMPSSRGSS